MATTSAPTRLTACVILHGRPVAYAIVHRPLPTYDETDPSATPPPADTFADRMIHGTHREHYAERAIKWSASAPERGGEIVDGVQVGGLSEGAWVQAKARWAESVQRWTVWTLDGRAVAWTRAGIDESVVGPVIRFGQIDGPVSNGAALVRVRREDAASKTASALASSASRVFAAMLEAADRPVEDAGGNAPGAGMVGRS